MQNTLKTIALAGAGLCLAGTAPAEEEINFEKQIYPLIEESCKKCHRPPYEDERGRTRRPKAGLVVTDAEALMKGAEEDDEYHAVIVPGKPDESSFLTRTMLPITDDDHMPPEDKAPQWTDEDKELVKKWIAAGADFGDWDGDPKPNEVPEE